MGRCVSPIFLMSIHISIEELLRYSSEERDKWRQWLLAHPAAMESPVQPTASFPTVGKLIDHIFIAERRTLQRLQELPVSDATGLTANNVPPLFDYGASVRRELEQYVRDLGEDEADEVRQISIRDRPWALTPRKMLFHVLFHEVRHWAQVALALRLAGFDPPGNHDLLFSTALR
jgi:uncharacterized damage-inducible protein DinB